jgi:hypothetical protein
MNFTVLKVYFTNFDIPLDVSLRRKVHWPEN